LFDLHCHLLPGLDDGAKTIQESQDVIRDFYDNGINGLCFTPHLAWERNEDFFARVKPVFDDMNVRFGKDLDLFLGAEVMCDEKALNPPFCINETKYYLLEFSPFAPVLESYFEAIFKAQLNGFKPILSHIERYDITRNYSQVDKWLSMDITLTINADSLMPGSNYNRIAWHLLESGMIHIVASDSHGSSVERANLYEGYDLIRKRFGKETADILCNSNPRGIVDGKQPKLPTPKKRSWLFSLLKGDK
jgi:protein-tyrosine phosphatase